MRNWLEIYFPRQNQTLLVTKVIQKSCNPCANYLKTCLFLIKANSYATTVNNFVDCGFFLTISMTLTYLHTSTSILKMVTTVGRYVRISTNFSITAVALPAPLGQALSNVQGHCRVAATSSFGAKALNCKESPCSGACLQLLCLGWTIPLIKKQFKHYLIFWPVLLRFLPSWGCWRYLGRWLLLQLRIIQKTPCFISCYNLVEKRAIFVSIIF